MIKIGKNCLFLSCPLPSYRKHKFMRMYKSCVNITFEQRKGSARYWCRLKINNLISGNGHKKTLTRPWRAICHAMVSAVGVALHSKMLMWSTGSERKRLDKQHLGLRSCHMSCRIDKHWGRSLGNFHNRGPCRMSDVDYMLMA
jgi:hypothetical protein